MHNAVCDHHVMDYDDWFDDFRPIQNLLDEYADFDGTKFETYGAELQQVEAADPSCVWTLLDGDGDLVVVSGFRFINRIGYFVTERSWTEEMLVEFESNIRISVPDQW